MINFSFLEDPGLGSVTPLESALDGFYKLSRVVEEVFGGDTFSVGKKKENQKQNGQGTVEDLNFIKRMYIKVFPKPCFLF